MQGQDFLKNALDFRKQENAYRELVPERDLVDFCSNDYLGFSKNPAIQLAIQTELSKVQNKNIGATGSRLLTGNSRYAENVESNIAAFHKAESALFFNSGYDANIGLLSCIAKKTDTIIYDSLSHASIIDGVKLSIAGKKFKFAHNSISDLEKKIKHSTGNIFVVVESLYSMDGDFAPLKEIEEICAKNNALLIIDEAHANGIFGENGSGIVCEHGLENKVFARIHTFGKAIGAHGAAVLGSKSLKEYLINFSRPLIYTTALPLHAVVAIKCCYQSLETSGEERKKLFEIFEFYKSTIAKLSLLQFANASPIQAVVISGNSAVKKVSQLLVSNGFDVRPILSPTVARGKERLRICLHSYNTKKEIETMLQLIRYE